MSALLERLGRFCARKRIYVIAVWLVLVVGTVVGNVVAGGEESNTFTLPGTESQQASDVLADNFPSRDGTSATIVFDAAGGVSAQESEIESVRQAAQALPDVIDNGVSDPFAPAPFGAVSEDGTIAYSTVTYGESTAELGVDAANELEETVDAFQTGDLEIEVGGFLIVNTEPIDTGGSEEIGLLAAIVILLITLGAVAAMGVPILSALVGVGTGLAAIGLLANVLTVPSIAPAGAVMIGLGVGIDYSLFVVGRYRGFLAEGLTPEEAAGRTTATSGRAIVTAGATVVVALLGLLIFEVPAVSVIAIAIGVVVVISIFAAITLLPALLGLIGHRVDWGRIGLFNRSGRDPAGHRWAAFVTRVPAVSIALAVAALIALAIPMLSLELGPSDATDSPEDSTERKAYDLITEGFGPGYNNPFLGVIQLPSGSTADADTVAVVETLLNDLAATPDVAAVLPTADSLSNPQVLTNMFNPAETTGAFQLVAGSAAKDERTPELIDQLRNDVVPSAIAGSDLEVLIGGTSAAYVDLDDRISERLVFFIIIVILISWVILFTSFRSVAVPLTAGIFNLLVIGAAYGVLVAVFQWGWAASLIGVENETPVISYLAPIVFAVLFGLSMDYEVYIVSRIQEEHEKDGDAARAVRDGLGSAARMVVAAATIMFFVFFAFVLSPSIVMKMFGLGLGIAIVVDAFLVRMVLLPAVLRLLGRAAWFPQGRARSS